MLSYPDDSDQFGIQYHCWGLSQKPPDGDENKDDDSERDGDDDNVPVSPRSSQFPLFHLFLA